MSLSNIQLKAIRQLLFFTIEEAAAMVAATAEKPQGVHPALWMDWEQGNKKIPDYIEDTLVDLLDFRLAAIETATEKLQQDGDEDEYEDMDEDEDDSDEPTLVAIWYDKVEDFTSLPGCDPILWKPQCSVVAELIGTFGADAVPFNAKVYKEWLGNRKDTDSLRAQWAASVAGLETSASTAPGKPGPTTGPKKPNRR